MVRYISKERDMIDMICFKHYGTHDGGVVEVVLNANDGLALQPAILPAGVVIELPELQPKQVTPLVRLWD